MENVQTGFLPAQNGFRFQNYFQLRLPVSYPLPFVGKLDLNDIVFGLCGGMCAAALDYFYAGIPAPTGNDPARIEKKLFTFLCERQLQSLSLPVVLRIIEWMMAEDADLAAKMIRTEIPKLRRQINRQKPVVLCLIRTQGMGNPTLNHQVLATGYEISADQKSLTIFLYDPNHPGEEPRIVTSLQKPGFTISQSTNETVRGFFVLPYTCQKNLPITLAPFQEGISFGAPAESFQLHWPVDSRVCTQFFNEHPDWYRGFGLPGHEGLDLLALDDAQIYACADGEVIEAGSRPGGHPYGTQVRIRHHFQGQEYQTIYAHLSKTLVQVGQSITAGQVIGKADSTGNSTGSHLHLTLKKIGTKTSGYPDNIVDPWPYFLSAITPLNEPLPSPSGITVYTIGQINVRKQPTTDADIITSLPASEELAVLGQASSITANIGKPDHWLQIQTASGLVGYVAAWLVSDTRMDTFPPSGLIVFPTGEMNLRAGPGTAYASLIAISSSDPLSVLGNAETARARIDRQNEWLLVQSQSGQRGFVAAWLVHLTGQAPAPAGLIVYPTATANLRARPSMDGNVLSVVMPGDALDILGDKAQAQSWIGQQGRWLNVRTSAKIVGYIAAWLVQCTNGPLVAAADGLSVFTTEDVNIRAQPGVNSPRITGAVRGECLQVIDTDLSSAKKRVGKNEQWLYVHTNTGARGWVAAWFLSLNPV